MSNNDSDAPAPRRRAVWFIVAAVVGVVAIGAPVCCIGGWIVMLAINNPTAEQRDQRIKEQADERWKVESKQATSDQYQARAFVDYWLLLLDMKNLDEPYRLTSKAFQANMPRQQFDDFIRNRPHLKREHTWSHGVDGKPGDHFEFLLHSRKSGGREFTNSTVAVQREAGDWRLDSLKDGP